MEKKRTPRLRFRGFTDDWEQRKVTELGNIYIGLVTTMTAHYTNDGILLIRNSDIKDGKFEFDTEPIYLDKEFAKQNKSRMHKVGDVITVHTGDVGTSAVITENENNSIGFATIVTRPNKQVLDSWYLSTFLNTEKHKAWAVQMSTGDGRTNYNLMDYTELIVPVPKLEEQKMIASTMSNLNHLITLHQRKYDMLKKVKKAMLEKLFPKNGKKVPGIRFAGFTDDWEQRKLGELATFTKGAGYSKSDLKESGTPVVLYGRLYTKYETVIRDVDTFVDAKDGSIYSRGGEVVVPASGETAEDIAIASTLEKSGILIGGDLNIIHPCNRLEPVFLAISISNGEPHVEMARRAQGKSVVHLHNEDLSRIELQYPEIEEQQKISQCFLNLDHLITLHQRKLEKLNKLKKSMLEEMFV